MEATQPSIVGTWVLHDGSEQVQGLDGIPGLPFSLQLSSKSKGQKLRITCTSSGNIEELKFKLLTKRGDFTNFYQLSSLNYEKNGVLSTVTSIDPLFREVVILRLGPIKNQRTIEKFSLSHNGRELRVEVKVESQFNAAIKTIIFLKRAEVEPVSSIPLIIHYGSEPSGYIDSTIYDREFLTSLRLHIPDILEKVINSKSSNMTSMFVDYAPSRLEETRRFDGTCTVAVLTTSFFHCISHIICLTFSQFLPNSCH